MNALSPSNQHLPPLSESFTPRMDARVYFHLVDAIADASSVTDLSTVREMIDCADMHPKEREALSRAFQARERTIRGSDSEVLKLPTQRAD